MTGYVLLFLASVFISSVSQILLKKNAGIVYPNKFREYANVKAAVAYGLFFAASLITVWAYKFVPLSMGPILESSGYFFVTILSVIFLKEKVGLKKGIGLGLILTGIAVFSFL